MCQTNSFTHSITEFNLIFGLVRNILVKKHLTGTDRTYLDIFFACLQSIEYLRLHFSMLWVLWNAFLLLLSLHSHNSHMLKFAFPWTKYELMDCLTAQIFWILECHQIVKIFESHKKLSYKNVCYYFKNENN